MRLLLVTILLLAAPALAGPFVVSDPVDQRCTHCGVFMDAASKLVIAVTAQGVEKICKHDLAGISTGSHTVRMTCIVNDPVWGDQESAQSLPLTFVKPISVAPGVPASIRLVPQ